MTEQELQAIEERLARDQFLLGPEFPDHTAADLRMLLDEVRRLRKLRELPEAEEMARMAGLVSKYSARLAIAENALDRIRDPRKRHKEPDAYTELACVMHIANEALEGK